MTEDNNHYNHTKTKKPYPKSRLRSTVEFDFLQYVRIAFKWATSNYDLNRGQVEMLLYLYPKGAFSSKQYSDFQRTISMYQDKELKKFISNGWITLWRKKKENSTISLMNRESRWEKTSWLMNSWQVRMKECSS